MTRETGGSAADSPAGRIVTTSVNALARAFVTGVPPPKFAVQLTSTLVGALDKRAGIPSVSWDAAFGASWDTFNGLGSRIDALDTVAVGGLVGVGATHATGGVMPGSLIPGPTTQATLPAVPLPVSGLL